MMTTMSDLDQIKVEEFLKGFAEENEVDDYIGPGRDSYYIYKFECKTIEDCYVYNGEGFLLCIEDETIDTFFRVVKRYPRIDIDILMEFLYKIDEKFRARMKEIKSEQQAN